MIGRTPSAVAMKAVNFASLDPTIPQKGMSNTSALDKAVWDEFFANMDQFLASDKVEQDTTGFQEISQARYLSDLPEGLDIIASVKTRQNQGFFREMVLASYDETCALTSISSRELLVASHIVPWMADNTLRMNPQNGICLNALHDRAFDRGLISFSENLTVLYSNQLTEESGSQLREISARTLVLPKRFHPNPEFLNFHRNNVFRP